jgi:hypothetical protein
MKYAVEMCSGATYRNTFHKDYFRHSKLDGGGGYTETDSMVIS